MAEKSVLVLLQELGDQITSQLPEGYVASDRSGVGAQIRDQKLFIWFRGEVVELTGIAIGVKDRQLARDISIPFGNGLVLEQDDSFIIAVAIHGEIVDICVNKDALWATAQAGVYSSF